MPYYSLGLFKQPQHPPEIQPELARGLPADGDWEAHGPRKQDRLSNKSAQFYLANGTGSTHYLEPTFPSKREQSVGQHPGEQGFTAPFKYF